MNDLKNLIGQVTSGNVDRQALGDAASEHVNSMDSGQLTDHLQTAAQNAQQNGQGDLASQIQGVITQAQSNPDAAKGAVVELIKNNPQIIQHFAPQFAQGILGKLGV